MPASTPGSRCARKRSSVTTPTFPPPPRSAQYSSASCPRVGGDPAAVGEDHLRAEQAVQGQAEPAAQRPVPAGEGQPGHAHVADGAGGHHQVVRAGGGQQPGSRDTAADGERGRVHVDVDRAQTGQVEHHTAVAQRPAGPVVPSGADRQRQVALGGDEDRARPPRRRPGTGATRDRRALEPHRSRAVVVVTYAGIARLVQPVAEQGAQPGGGRRDIGGGGGDHGDSSTGAYPRLSGYAPAAALAGRDRNTGRQPSAVAITTAVD